MRLFFLLPILLVACTTAPPTNSLPIRIEKPEFAKGFEIHHYSDHSSLLLFDLEKNGDTIATVSINPASIGTFACQSTTHVTYLDALHKSESISACAFADRLANPNLQQRLKDGRLINLTSGGELDKELLWTSGATFFFVYPFDKLAPDIAPKNKMTVVPISEYLESHPLARAEWIKVFGLFAGESKKADLLFQQIKDRYLKKKQENLSSQHPRVFFGSKEGDLWYAGPANSYIAQLINDAGGEYLFNKEVEKGNLRLSQEEMIQRTWDIDFFGAMVYQDINPNSRQLLELAPGMEKAPTFQGQKVFYCNAALNDFFGQALLEPDILLGELSHIFQKKSPQEGARYFLMP